MKISLFTTITISLIIFLVSCQAQTPVIESTQAASMRETIEANVLTQVAPTFFPPTLTPDLGIISISNVNQLTLQSINLGRSVYTIYSSDGKWLYISSTTGIYSIDTISYKEIRQVSSIPWATLSPNRKLVISWRGVSIFSADGDQKFYDFQLVPGVTVQPPLDTPVVSADGSLIAQHYNDDKGNWIAIWKLADGKLIDIFKGRAIEFSSDSRLIAIQGYEPSQVYDKQYNTYVTEDQDHVFLYDLQTSERLRDWPGIQSAFLSDNSLAVEADGYVRVFDPTTYKARHSFAGTFATFSSDEQMVAALFNDHINIYRVSDGKLLHQLDNKLSSIDRAELAFSADGQVLAGTTVDLQCCGGGTSNLSIWRVVDGALIKNLSPSGFVFSPDGQTILTGGQILRTSDGSLIAELPRAFIGGITNLAFTSDGQQIIVANNKNLYLYPIISEQIWVPQEADPETYLPILQAASPTNSFGLPFDLLPPEEIHSLDGRFLAKLEKGVATISSIQNGTELFTVPTDPASIELAQALSYMSPNGVTRVAFSPNGQIAAFGLHSGAVELWNLNSIQKIFTISPLIDFYHYVTGLAFSPNGKLLAISSEGGILRLYGINVK